MLINDYQDHIEIYNIYMTVKINTGFLREEESCEIYSPSLQTSPGPHTSDVKHPGEKTMIITINYRKYMN